MHFAPKHGLNFLLALSLAASGYAADIASSPVAPDRTVIDQSAAVLAGIGPVPALNSDPGAPYTVYLDFGGFSFTGNWGNNATYTPGSTPAYSVDGDTSTFSATDLANIQKVWSRVAQKYAPFNVNVTTVDPAVIAGQAASDLIRQNYYDSQPRTMHTVVGGAGSWISGAGGVSYLGVTAGAQTGSNGYHTNWVFSAQSPTDLQFVADGAAHENGHGFSLSHQSDYTGTTLVHEYSSGTTAAAPIMGDTYSVFNSQQRGLWAKGTADVNGRAIQNDPMVIANNLGMGGYREDNIGHTVASATPLSINGGTIDSSSATGIIVPGSLSNPDPIGASNYSTDFFAFGTTGGTATINLVSGISTITPGSADPSPTLDGTLGLFSNGTLINTFDTTSLNESFTMSLDAGTYELEVLSHGGLSDPASNNRGFYDMGSYFITGTVSGAVSVPEPACLLGVGVVLLLARRRR